MTRAGQTGQTRLRRWVLALLMPLILVLLALLASPLWLPAATDHLLRSDWLHAQLNADPDALSVTWRSAQIVAWGRGDVRQDSAWGAQWVEVQLDGFKLRRQDEVRQWQVQVAHTQLRLALYPLLAYRLRMNHVKARGVQFSLRPRLPAWPVHQLLSAAETYPMIADVNGLLLPDAATARRSPTRWSVRLQDVHAAEVQQVWIGPWRCRMQASVQGGLALSRGIEDILLRDLTLQATNARVWRGQALLAKDVDATVRTQPIGPLPAGELPRRLKAHVGVSGKLNAGWLLAETNQRLRRRLGREIAVVAGWAQLGGTIDIADAMVRAGSRLRVTTPRGDVRAVVRGVTVRARGPLLLSLLAEDAQLAVTVRMAPATLRSTIVEAVSKPGVRTASLTLTGSVAMPRAVPGAAVPAHSAWRLRWAETEPAPLVPLLQGLRTKDIRVSAGHWRVAGDLTLRERPDGSLQARGEASARVVGMIAKFAGQRLRGDVIATVPFRFSEVGVEITGANVRLQKGRLRVKNHPTRNWRGAVRVRSGRVRILPDTKGKLTPTLLAKIRGEFSDAGPLIDVVRRRAGVPDFVLRRIDTGHLRIAAQLNLSPSSLSFRSIRATSTHVNARGGLRLRSGKLAGGLLLRVFRLHFGLGLRTGGVETHLVNAQRWFDRSGW